MGNGESSLSFKIKKDSCVGNRSYHGTHVKVCGVSSSPPPLHEFRDQTQAARLTALGGKCHSPLSNPARPEMGGPWGYASKWCVLLVWHMRQAVLHSVSFCVCGHGGRLRQPLAGLGSE